MVKVKELEITVVNGRRRKMALWECTECNTTKEGRSDMKQASSFCRSCSNKTHGMEGTKIYNCWLTMKARCYNPKNNRYSTHGQRGVIVCDEWKESSNTFIEWAYANGFNAVEGERNTEYTIDRIDNDGNYEPSNCQIVSLKEQQWNKQTLAKNNTSGYKGVTKKGNRWIAQLNLNGKVIFRVSCKTKIEAASKRERFIIQNKLPHQRNWADLVALPNNASTDEINNILKEI